MAVDDDDEDVVGTTGMMLPAVLGFSGDTLGDFRPTPVGWLFHLEKCHLESILTKVSRTSFDTTDRLDAVKVLGVKNSGILHLLRTYRFFKVKKEILY